MDILEDLVSFDKLISYQPKLSKLNQQTLEKYFHNAWWFVAEKLKLKPVVFSLLFKEESKFSILGDYLEVSQGKVFVKEVLDIQGAKLPSTTNYEKDVRPVLITDSIVFPSGSYMFAGSLIHCKGVVNVACYPYPLYSKQLVSPIMGFAVIAMIHSLYSKDRQDLSSAGMYENLALHYIDLYNGNIEEPKVTNYERIIKVNPYGL